MQLCLGMGVTVESATVGDPDPMSAICDIVHATGVDRILLFARGRHVSSGYPLSVARRAKRLSGLPVESFPAAPSTRPRRRRRFVGGHCEPSAMPQLT
jgi:hypothetical protein